MLGLRCQSCLSTPLVSALSSSVTLGGSLRQASSTEVIYCPLGEYSVTTAKFWPLANSETCVSVSDLLDKFFTHLALVRSGAHVDGNMDGQLVVVAGVAIVEVDVLMLDGI